MASKKSKQITEKSEVKRLSKIFELLPLNTLEVAQGLIIQAARHRVRLDYLWADIQENGETETFCQSERVEPYERKRPVTELYATTDTNYLKIMAKLLELVPEEQRSNKLKEILDGDG